MEPRIAAANPTPPVGSARALPWGLLDVQEKRGNEGRKPGLGSVLLNKSLGWDLFHF